MLITSSGRFNQENIGEIKDIARRYNLDYVERKKQSISHLMERYNDDVLVVGNDLSIHLKDEEEVIKYHPNIAMVRAKRVINQQSDAFLEACQLNPGMSFLDCTAGLGADSLIASIVLGSSGTITALENNFKLHLLLQEGLQNYQSHNDNINEAMRRIKVVHADHTAYLKKLEDNSIDVVYFDPMFTMELEESSGIRPIKSIVSSGLSDEAVIEAKRVARKKVVLKDDFRSQRFSYFGFRQIIRKSSKFHFGVIDIDL